MWGGSPEAVSKHVMQKPKSKRRKRETDQTRMEPAQRPKPWVRNREKSALQRPMVYVKITILEYCNYSVPKRLPEV
jgi:hypothetical protein